MPFVRLLMRRSRTTLSSRMTRFFSSEENRAGAIKDALEKFGAQHLSVKDVSGGCGSFFNVHIVSENFEGMNRVKRERTVHKVLSEHIPSLHGISLRCMTPSQFESEKEEN